MLHLPRCDVVLFVLWFCWFATHWFWQDCYAEFNCTVALDSLHLVVMASTHTWLVMLGVVSMWITQTSGFC
ncbi:hypothetical protein DFH28DRAFT_982049 [Melampsora americana]|nr:hypothetical protein DFH28DRAFT_982049 [Melampsora americana]